MFDINRIKGPFATMVTPFKEGNIVDEEALTKEVDALCNTGITGVFPLATTGEFPFFSIEEKRRCLEITARVNNGRKAMIAGACGVNYSESMEIIKIAAELGYDACIACSPYYYTQSADELVKYYTALCANPYGMKILMYNIPAFTSEVPMSVVAEMIKNPNCVGIKDSSGNMRRMRQAAHLKDEAGRHDFIVYCGSDDIILPALVAGCEGSLSAMSVCMPELVSEMYKAYTEGRLSDAQEYQDSFIELGMLADGMPFPAGYKYLTELRGLKHKFIHQFVDEKKAEDTKKKQSEILDKLLIKYNLRREIF